MKQEIRQAIRDIEKHAGTAYYTPESDPMCCPGGDDIYRAIEEIKKAIGDEPATKEIRSCVSIRWNEGYSSDDKDHMREEGFERAYEMIKQGYTEGELYFTPDGEDADQISGWWRLEK